MCSLSFVKPSVKFIRKKLHVIEFIPVLFNKEKDKERQLEKSRNPWSNFKQKEMETFA